jgi:hypothetical protein
MHKFEAIRLIRKELAKGADIPEAMILAAMSLIRPASEGMKKGSTSVQSEAEISPFKPPQFLMQW